MYLNRVENTSMLQILKTVFIVPSVLMIIWLGLEVYLSTYELITKMWYTHKIEYYLSIKRNKVLISAIELVEP